MIKLSMLRGLMCMPIILAFFLMYKIMGSKNNFWEHMIKYVDANRSPCMGKWLLISAISDQDPERILRVYISLKQNNTKIRLSKRTAIAVFESAIWVKNKVVATSLLNILKGMKPALSGHGRKRIDLLYLWRFSEGIKNAIGISGLLSPLIPYEAVLPYVECFAKATTADFMGKFDAALKLYQESLKYMPQNSSEYKYAMERCNVLLNSKINVESKGSDSTDI